MDGWTGSYEGNPTLPINLEGKYLLVETRGAPYLSIYRGSYLYYIDKGPLGYRVTQVTKKGEDYVKAEDPVVVTEGEDVFYVASIGEPSYMNRRPQKLIQYKGYSLEISLLQAFIQHVYDFYKFGDYQILLVSQPNIYRQEGYTLQEGDLLFELPSKDMKVYTQWSDIQPRADWGTAQFLEDSESVGNLRDIEVKGMYGEYTDLRCLTSVKDLLESEGKTLGDLKGIVIEASHIKSSVSTGLEYFDFQEYVWKSATGEIGTKGVNSKGYLLTRLKLPYISSEDTRKVEPTAYGGIGHMDVEGTYIIGRDYSQLDEVGTSVTIDLAPMQLILQTEEG